MSSSTAPSTDRRSSNSKNTRGVGGSASCSATGDRMTTASREQQHGHHHQHQHQHQLQHEHQHQHQQQQPQSSNQEQQIMPPPLAPSSATHVQSFTAPSSPVNSKLHYILHKDSQQSLQQASTQSLNTLNNTSNGNGASSISVNTAGRQVGRRASRPESPGIHSPLSASPTPRESPSIPASPNAGSGGGGLQQTHGSQSSLPVKETHFINIDYDPVSGRKTLNKYEIIRELGRGQHGKVKLGRDVESDEYVAIKIVGRTSRPRLGKPNSNSQEEKIKQEIAILKKCSHPNIVRLIEVLDDVSSKKIYLVLEYLEKGEVSWQSDTGQAVMTRQEAKSTSRDVLLGLEYLHYQGIIHRDIKPANLLLSGDGRVKISDFGVSYATSPGTANDEYELAKTAGTPAFFAPELCLTSMCETRPMITSKIDIWAFGVTLFCLLYGKVPFTADSEFELFNVIANQPLSFPDEEEQVLEESTSVPRFESMFYYRGQHQELNATANKRKTVHEPLTMEERPIPKKMDADLELAKDLMRKLMEKDPEKRISIEEIKRHPWICDGMESAEVDQFLRNPADVDARIEVSGEEVRHAVQGIGSKIKRGLTKFGSSALQFAGLRRKSSTSSTASSKVVSNSASTSRSSSREPQSRTSSNRQSATEWTSIRPRVQTTAAIDSRLSKGQPAAPYPSSSLSSSVSSSNRGMPLSSSNMNLNALLEGDTVASQLHIDDVEDFDYEDYEALSYGDDESQIAGFKRQQQQQQQGAERQEQDSMRTTTSNNTERESRSRYCSPRDYSVRRPSHHSSDDDDDDDDDDNGELTLVLGPQRAVSQSPSTRLGSGTSGSNLRGRADGLRNVARDTDKTNDNDAHANDDEDSLARHRSHSVTVAMLRRGTGS